MQTKEVLGVEYLFLGGVEVIGGGQRQGYWRVLLEHNCGKPLAAFASTTVRKSHVETSRSISVTSVLPAETVFTDEHKYKIEHSLPPYGLTFKALTYMMEYRRSHPLHQAETVENAAKHVATPLFRAGVVDLSKFVDSACRPHQELITAFPDLKSFANSARRNEDAWRRGDNLDDMLKELTETLAATFWKPKRRILAY